MSCVALLKDVSLIVEHSRFTGALDISLHLQQKLCQAGIKFKYINLLGRLLFTSEMLSNLVFINLFLFSKITVCPENGEQPM